MKKSIAALLLPLALSACHWESVEESDKRRAVAIETSDDRISPERFHIKIISVARHLGTLQYMVCIEGTTYVEYYNKLVLFKTAPDDKTVPCEVGSAK